MMPPMNRLSADEGRELPPLGEDARRNRRRGVHEHHLEEEVGEDGGGVVHAGKEEPGVAHQVPAMPAEGDADRLGEGGGVRRLAQGEHGPEAAGLNREADRPVRHHRDAVDHEVHGGGVRGILGAGEAGLDHREAELHQHDQEARHQGPDEVDGDSIRDRGRIRGVGDRVRRGVNGRRRRGDGGGGVGRSGLRGKGRGHRERGQHEEEPESWHRRVLVRSWRRERHCGRRFSRSARLVRGAVRRAAVYGSCTELSREFCINSTFC